ncbi:MAG: J domain-containing protein [Melioribacteraceae bacterium]|nr:J domain-containing protein [Melioribacteraceae bacterium]
MDFKTAIEILELDAHNLTPDLIKKSYRRLSLKYHPDITANSDGAKFILINAAYEFLLKNLSFFDLNDLSETEDELKMRIAAIKKSFESIKKDYDVAHNNCFQKIVDNLISTLDNYNSYKRLKENVNYDFTRIVEIGINDILNWFNERIAQITTSYDDWINGYLRSTYKRLLEEEFRYWYKSKYFYTHLFISIIISELVFTGIYYLPVDKQYLGVASIPLFLGIMFYRGNVKNKYSFEVNIRKLDSDKFKLQSSALFIKNDDGTSIATTTLGLGSIGAALGAIGGPVGALIGGAIGGILGSMFGESLYELKQKLFDRMIPKLEEVEQRLFASLDEQIPKIEEELIMTIQNNFNSNKERAVKLLLKS